MLCVRSLLLGLALAALAGAPATAQSIYPLDRAEILLGSKFDFKVELEGNVAADASKVTINGRDAAAVLGKPPAI
jgi:alkaline phosphatase